MSKIIWLLKQLLPLTYRTTYVEDDRKIYSVWKMWFGVSYKVDKVYYTAIERS